MEALLLLFTLIFHTNTKLVTSKGHIKKTKNFNIHLLKYNTWLIKYTTYYSILHNFYSNLLLHNVNLQMLSFNPLNFWDIKNFGCQKPLGKVFVWNQMHPKFVGFHFEVKHVCHRLWFIISFIKISIRYIPLTKHTS